MAMNVSWSRRSGQRADRLGVACAGHRDTVSGLDKRFSWPDNVPTERTRADYEVSGTVWLTLVEKFGLAPYLKNRGNNAAS